MRWGLVAGLAWLGVAWGSAPAHACGCQESTPQLAWTHAGAVFVGEVVATEPGPQGDGSDGNWETRLRIVEALKNLEDREEVTVRAPRGAGRCGIPFEAGRRYLVYARQWFSEDWLTDRCMRTR